MRPGDTNVPQASAAVAQLVVGWVERSETHHDIQPRGMGFANPQPILRESVAREARRLPRRCASERRAEKRQRIPPSGLMGKSAECAPLFRLTAAETRYPLPVRTAQRSNKTCRAPD